MFKTIILSLGLLLASNAFAEKQTKEGGYFGAKTATHPSWFKESFLDLEEDIADSTEKKQTFSGVLLATRLPLLHPAMGR